jgi:hypothetical protein
MAEPYRVFVVLDRAFGERLADLAQKGSVWIVDTTANRTVAQHIWGATPTRSHLDGVTTFKTGDDCSPEASLIQQLDTIDLHHGVYSANPPCTVLEVIGTEITERVKAEFAELGFDQFEPTLQGFRAIRPLPKDWSPDRWGDESADRCL